MSQPEASPHSRSAIIAHLACMVGEVASLQDEHAKHGQQIAGLQSRLGQMIRDLSCSTAGTGRPPSLPELRERLGDVRGRLEVTLDKVQNSAERPAPAAQAASPPVHAPEAQSEGPPVEVGKASDERSVGVSGKGGLADQSEELRHVAGAGGESAASADTAPAADAKPKRTFPQPMPDKATEMPLARPTAEIHKQPPYKPSGPAAVDPMVPRREPQTLRAGGGLMQDGGSKTDAPPRPVTTKDRVLDLYAETVMGPAEIAKELGIAEKSAGPYVSVARAAKDPRVIKGDEARTKFRGDRALNLYADGALSMYEIDRNLRTAAGTAAKLVEMARQTGDARVTIGDRHRAPKRPPPADPPAVTQPVKAEIPESCPIVVIGPTVCGPTGSWVADPKVAKAIKVLSDGQIYGTDRIATVSGIAENVVISSLGLWSAALAKIGVDLVHTRGIGVKLNRRSAA